MIIMFFSSYYHMEFFWNPWQRTDLGVVIQTLVSAIWPNWRCMPTQNILSLLVGQIWISLLNLDFITSLLNFNLNGWSHVVGGDGNHLYSKSIGHYALVIEASRMDGSIWIDSKAQASEASLYAFIHGEDCCLMFESLQSPELSTGAARWKQNWK